MGKILSTPIVISSGNGEGTFVIVSTEDAAQWRDAQKAIYDPVYTIPYYAAVTSPMRAANEDLCNRITNAVRQSEAGDDSEWEGVKKVAEDKYSGGTLISGLSPRGLFLKGLIDHNSLEALGAHVYFRPVKLDVSYNNELPVSIIRGMAKAAVFEGGGSTALKACADRFDILMAEWNSGLVASRAKLRELVGAAESDLSKSNILLGTAELDSIKRAEKHTADLDTLLKTSRARMEKITNDYEDLMALKSPVGYWRDKRKEHIKWASVWSICFGIFVLGVLILAFGVFPTWLNGEADTGHPASTIPAVAGVINTPTWKLGTLIVIAVIIIWTMRILARLTLSQMHLATDAGHRSTLIQTYLSLRRRNKITDGEREFLFKSIFRPAVTGLVRDDAMPTSPWSIITSSGDSKK